MAQVIPSVGLANQQKRDVFQVLVRDSIATKFIKLPISNFDTIISMHLPLSVQQHATLLSVYAPTLQADPAVKEDCYTDLRCLLRNVPANDKIVILGNFNTRVDRAS